MLDHDIEAMALAVVAALRPVLKRPDEPSVLETAARALRAHWTGKIALVWNAADVINLRPDLSLGQADEVLGYVLRNHDASVGVDWDTIFDAAKEVAHAEDRPMALANIRAAIAAYIAAHGVTAANRDLGQHVVDEDLDDYRMEDLANLVEARDCLLAPGIWPAGADGGRDGAH